MITTELNPEKLATLRLAMIPGIGPRTIAHLREHCHSAEGVFLASREKLAEVPRLSPKLVAAIAKAKKDPAVHEIVQWCHDHQVHLVTIDEGEYPQNLQSLPDAPAVLFYRGAILRSDSLAVAIVGARHATSYGIKQAERFARGLAAAGVTVVSGLARGIDAAAHRGAIEGGGRTIAVLGGGLAHIYPPEHHQLAADIALHGALVTESSPAAEPRGSVFPQRNRIISGLSLGVLVIEAAARSGSLITARHAGEQGREIFALPGPVTSRVSQGCHQLIRDGAQLVTCVEELLEHLGPTATPIERGAEQTMRQGAELLLNEQELAVLNAIDPQSTSIDQVCRQSQLPIHRVLATISVLEKRHLIRRLSGQYVSRI